MTLYCKLVRDRIPEIIKKQGGKANYCALEKEEFLQQLHSKLDEEVQEFHKDMNLEELADILEVVYAFADTISSREELIKVFDKKHEERGGFAEHCFLISKE